MKKLYFLFFSIFLSLGISAQSTLAFDGYNDYINLGSSAANNVRTVEMWFKLDYNITPSLNSFKVLCSRETSSNNINEWHLSFTQTGTVNYNKSGHLRFAVVSSVGNVQEVFSDTNHWDANRWYHVAAVIHPVQGTMLFVDGKKQRDTRPNHTSATPVMNHDLEIARQRGFSRHFQGEIDDFHLSSTALYTSDFTPPCPDRQSTSGTIGLWNFNTQSGNTAFDAGPNTNDVTIHGATWDTSRVCGGTNNNSLHFDGVDDYVNLGPNAGNNIRTIEFWFKLDHEITFNNTYYTMICNRESGSSNLNEWHISFTPSGTRISQVGTMRFAVVSSVGNAQEVLSDTNYWSANQWYHVAAVIDSVQGMMLFIDGIKQKDTRPNHTSATPAMTDDFEIGRQRGFTRYFHGNIDDFHLSTEALYTSNFIPPCPGRAALNSTVGLWNLDQSSGRIAFDSGPLQNDVSVYGAIWDSSFVCVPYNAPVGIEAASEVHNKSNIVLYPNPTDGLVLFKGIEFNELRRVSVYGLDGKLVKEIELNMENRFELPEKQGYYLIRFETRSGELIQRTVIRQ